MNPLMNRLFENRSSTKKRRPNSLKDELSNQKDRILIPKLKTKIIADIPDITGERQKTTILKPNVTKLPSLAHELPASSLKNPLYRQRKISMREPETNINFMT